MGFLNNGNLQRGDKVDLFLRYEECKTIPADGGDYSIFTFVDRDGCKVSFYGTMKSSPLPIQDHKINPAYGGVPMHRDAPGIELGDCLEVVGKFAKYVHLRNGDEITQINFVKIMNDKGKKSS